MLPLFLCLRIPYAILNKISISALDFKGLICNFGKSRYIHMYKVKKRVCKTASLLRIYCNFDLYVLINATTIGPEIYYIMLYYIMLYYIILYYIILYYIILYYIIFIILFCIVKVHNYNTIFYTLYNLIPIT